MSVEKSLSRRIGETIILSAVSTFTIGIVGSAVALVWTKAVNVDTTIKMATEEIVVTQHVYGEELERQKGEDINLATKIGNTYDRTVENRDSIADAKKRVSALEELILDDKFFSTEEYQPPLIEEHSLSETESEAKQAIDNFQMRQMAVPPVQETLKSYKKN